MSSRRSQKINNNDYINIIIDLRNIGKMFKFKKTKKLQKTGYKETK